MNKYLTIIAAIFLLLCSCSKEESNEPLPPAESNVYYVKYEVKVLVPNHFNQTITYTTESGVRQFLLHHLRGREHTDLSRKVIWLN